MSTTTLDGRTFKYPSAKRAPSYHPLFYHIKEAGGSFNADNIDECKDHPFFFVNKEYLPYIYYVMAKYNPEDKEEIEESQVINGHNTIQPRGLFTNKIKNFLQYFEESELFPGAFENRNKQTIVNSRYPSEPIPLGVFEVVMKNDERVRCRCMGKRYPNGMCSHDYGNTFRLYEIAEGKIPRLIDSHPVNEIKYYLTKLQIAFKDSNNNERLLYRDDEGKLTEIIE